MTTSHDAGREAPTLTRMLDMLDADVSGAPKREWYPVHREYLAAIMKAARQSLTRPPAQAGAASGEIPGGMVEPDMSWIDVAVSRTEGDELIVGYSDGFKGYIDEIHLCDCVDEYHAPPEPGLYRWSGFKVGSWDEGDAISLTGGSWTPYHLFTSKASAETGGAEDMRRAIIADLAADRRRYKEESPTWRAYGLCIDIALSAAPSAPATEAGEGA